MSQLLFGWRCRLAFVHETSIFGPSNAIGLNATLPCMLGILHIPMWRINAPCMFVVACVGCCACWIVCTIILDAPKCRACLRLYALVVVHAGSCAQSYLTRHSLENSLEISMYFLYLGGIYEIFQILSNLIRFLRFSLFLTPAPLGLLCMLGIVHIPMWRNNAPCMFAVACGWCRACYVLYWIDVMRIVEYNQDITKSFATFKIPYVTDTSTATVTDTAAIIIDYNIS